MPVVNASTAATTAPTAEIAASSRVASIRSTSSPAWPATGDRGPEQADPERGDREPGVGRLLDLEPEGDDRDPVAERREADRARDEAEVAIAKQAPPSSSGRSYPPRAALRPGAQQSIDSGTSGDRLGGLLLGDRGLVVERSCSSRIPSASSSGFVGIEVLGRRLGGSGSGAIGSGGAGVSVQFGVASTPASASPVAAPTSPRARGLRLDGGAARRASVLALGPSVSASAFARETSVEITGLSPSGSLGLAVGGDPDAVAAGAHVGDPERGAAGRRRRRSRPPSRRRGSRWRCSWSRSGSAL